MKSKMGCDQSKIGALGGLSPAKVERVIPIRVNNDRQKIIDLPNGKNKKPIEESRKALSPKPYQGVQNNKDNMDPQEFQNALQEYKECEENIRTLEREDPLTLFYIKNAHLKGIIEAIGWVQEKIDKLEKVVHNRGEKNMTMGKAQRDLRKVVVDYGGKDIVSKEEQEFLTSANRLEIATTELEMLKQEKALVESEIITYKSICVKLIQLYNRQDDIAKKLTSGATNHEEAKLNLKLADVESRKIKVSEALQRWKEARSQIIDACRQFAVALRKWREIGDDTPGHLYDLCEEVRDDLVSSLQCVTNARSYLTCELPYCSKMEMEVLEKAMSYIFIDMNTGERRNHAESCYKAFHNRTIALFAWIDETIKHVIQPEFEQAEKDMIQVTREVRGVRFQTIQKQFPHVTWKVTEEDKVHEELLSDKISSLSDSESIEGLKKFDYSQLSPLPSIEEVCGQTIAGRNNRATFLETATPETRSLIANGKSAHRNIISRSDTLPKTENLPYTDQVENGKLKQ